MEPRLKDVAEAAGVSVSSASYALRGSDQVSSATRKKVADAAERLGYRKNPLVSAWMQQVRQRKQLAFQGTLAFIHALDNEQDLRRGITFAEKVYQGVKESAAEQGFNLFEISLSRETNQSSVIDRMLYHRGVQGLIIGPIQRRDLKLDLRWHRYATVAIGHSFDEINFHRVVPDAFDGMLRLIDGLRQCGYQRPAFFVHQPLVKERVFRQFAAAFHWHYLERLQTPPPVYRASPGDTLEGVKKWISETQPDSIIGINEGGLSFLRKTGCRIPEEFGYVVLDKESMEPEAISHLDQCPELIGQVAFQELTSLLYFNQRGVPENPQTKSILGKWTAGRTTKINVQSRQ
jgi:DNA-binding LacI/PurR family transcriptional regulator